MLRVMNMILLVIFIRLIGLNKALIIRNSKNHELKSSKINQTKLMKFLKINLNCF